MVAADLVGIYVSRPRIIGKHPYSVKAVVLSFCQQRPAYLAGCRLAVMGERKANDAKSFGLALIVGIWNDGGIWNTNRSE
ncbi:hypothetical protein D9M73_263610 [compost metagenome]